MIFLDLFLGFLKVGCFAFGGAYGAIPLIRDVTLSYGWLTDDQISYMIAVSESTPGPIMLNLATYVGSSQAGFLGAALASFAVTLPSFVAILLVLCLYRSFIENKYVRSVLDGLKPCIIGIILATGVFMILNNLFHIKTGFSLDLRAAFITFVAAFSMFGLPAMGKKKLSPIKLIGLSAVLGIILYGI